jgi:anti-sigma B factor antagonist
MESPDKPQATVKPLVVPEIVTLPREVDISNARRLGRDLLGAFGPRATVVIADMSLTEFCDSSGIRHLLIANDAAMAWGGELRVVVPSPAVLRVMEITGVDQVLRIYSSLGEALTGAALRRGGRLVVRVPISR